MNPQPLTCKEAKKGKCGMLVAMCEWWATDKCLKSVPEPKYKRGETYYVKETWALLDGKYIYKADYTTEAAKGVKWKSPRFMPEVAARAYIKIKSADGWARVQTISRKDLEAEGFKLFSDFTAYWDAMYRDDPIKGYVANPWVWTYTFERVEKPQ